MKYTAAQVEAMRQAYPDFIMPGHVMRLDADGMMSFVPQARAASAPGALNKVYRSKRPLREDFPVAPIKKRTPQERLNSMTENILAGQREFGQNFGLSDEKVAELVTRSWKRGQPVTAEDVRAAAGKFLQEAENQFEARERKKIVRTAPSD